MNKDLLVKVLSIQSGINEDSAINKFIFEYLSGMDGVSVSTDSYGNIYAKKGEGKNGYKCMVSHTDTVHTICKNRKIYLFEDTLFAMASSNSRYRESDIVQVGVGGDDKCGVYACIQAMSDFDDIKTVFFRFEETGCNGSNNSDMKFFDDCNFVFQLDRRGSGDFITFTNGVECASAKFIEDSKSIYTDFGFSHIGGVSTDIGALKKKGLKVSAANISSGYYDPHSSFETVNIKALENSYNMVSEFFNKFGNVRYDHERTVYKLTSGVTQMKRKVKNVLSSNFFTRALDSLNGVVVEYESTFNKFVEIGNSGYYDLISDEYIEVDGAVCPECGCIGSVSYITHDNYAYCGEKDCYSEIEDDGEIIRKIELTDNGIVYVKSRVLNKWIKKSSAVYSVDLESYIKK